MIDNIKCNEYCYLLLLLVLLFYVYIKNQVQILINVINSNYFIIILQFCIGFPRSFYFYAQIFCYFDLCHSWKFDEGQKASLSPGNFPNCSKIFQIFVIRNYEKKRNHVCC